MAAEVVENDPPLEHQRGDEAAPGTMVVGEAVDQHDWVTTTDFEP
jgi:hypothetical protein